MDRNKRTIINEAPSHIRYAETLSSVCNDEDGFLHIETRGMYGQKVRVDLFEKDFMPPNESLLLGSKENVSISKNVAYVPIEMSGVHSKAKRLRNFEGWEYEIIARITPDNKSIKPFDSKVINLIIDAKKSDEEAKRSTVDGSMKCVIGSAEDEKKDCGGKYCITKSNYKEKNAGKLIQEINIRLAGFVGNVPTEEFDDRTESVIKQFQRDYMKVPETGKICGSLLRAIDEFCENEDYNFDFAQTKCPCAKGAKGTANYKACVGYGNAESKEYPGIHRSLIFALKGLLFYFKKTKSIYSLNKIESGYRCWADNNRQKRSSTNHMGCAFDLHFDKNGSRTSEVSDMEIIRRDFFCKYMNAPENSGSFGWELNKIGLEPKRFSNGKSGATSWVHVDVREFMSYKTNLYFTKDNYLISLNKMADIAKELKLTDMCNCKN